MKSLSLLLFAALLLIGCQTPPQAAIQLACDKSQPNFEFERCASSIAETWEIYQQRAADIVTNPATPPDVKQKVKQAEAATVEPVLSLLEAAAVVKRIRSELGAGTSSDERLAIANANLERWVDAATPVYLSFRNSLGF